ncbi:cache domain-containing protein [Archangium violaceum]|uniref:Cache domain-containing protein n=1 Tax=Archangium violaceum Cb vi76 TaxID=1406225 RepID=A0A084SJM9_9BACT|nr:cache domain-containing protein [Archangium violaceum]KFA88664.1 hypothetical protein Q664_39275 [Archangium violaceum Cb vi76]
MSARIAVVIVLSTLASYLHIQHTLRQEALEQLAQHAAERSAREEAIFLLAADNHALFVKAMAERIHSLTPEEVNGRFDSLFVRLPDGTVRNRRELFDGTRLPGVFIQRNVSVDLDMRRRILASYDTLLQYAPAFRTRFKDTFITLPEGPIISYWPERPDYCLDTGPDFSSTGWEYFLSSLPGNNPERKPAWSGMYTEDMSGKAMTTVTTPLDLEGRHVASISHDVLLEELVARTRAHHLPGAYNVLFRDDGALIAHPDLTEC